jgi:hypothetical protein
MAGNSDLPPDLTIRFLSRGNLTFWHGLLIGSLGGVVLTLLGLGTWTLKITREERLEAQAHAGCTPSWCPMTFDTEKAAQEALSDLVAQDKPREDL